MDSEIILKSEVCGVEVVSFVGGKVAVSALAQVASRSGAKDAPRGKVVPPTAYIFKVHLAIFHDIL
jgi:hypothetical protein